jgi:hypothetical protein
VFRVLGSVSTVCSRCRVVCVHCVQDAEWCEFIVFRVLGGVSSVYSGCGEV